MSHELNTPLGSVISFAELLLESPAGTDPQVRRDLQRIIGSAGHVTDLVRDILTFSKLGGGRLELELERCPLDELVSDAVAVVEPAMHQSGNRFTVDLPTEAVELYTDRVKVRQCLINVLGNAAKFTSHGQVSLTVQLQDQAVVFSVRDTGIGMSDSEIGRVFEPFVQADGSTTRRFGGTGLGLSITRGLCQLLGGSVTATSTLGAGSTFVLSVPRVSAPTAQQSSGATA
jgi:signal transduction histidine kinase